MIKNIYLKTFLFLLLSGCKSPLLQHELEGDRPILVSNNIAFENGELFARLDWIDGPMRAGGKFRVLFTNKINDFAAENLQDPRNVFYACLWMGVHGHGSSPMIMAKIDTGIFEFTDVEFIMNGAWEIRLYMLNEPEINDSCDVEVDGMREQIIEELQEIPVEI